jgi:hypothetical protein
MTPSLVGGELARLDERTELGGTAEGLTRISEESDPGVLGNPGEDDA